MAVEIGEVRRSQVITTFGPGAIIDMRSQVKGGGPVSVVAAGIDEWDRSASNNGNSRGIEHAQTINEPRLQKLLNVKGFRLPPVVARDENGRFESADRLVGVRFPTWLQCPGCHAIRWASKWARPPQTTWDCSCHCAECSDERGETVHVIPVRFITICESGCLDDFPWDQWVDHKDGCTQRGHLKLQGMGAGMKGLVLSCPKCDAEQTMDGCFGSEALKKFGNCRGNRPWLGDRDETCDKVPRTVYRGASNVYFPVLVSALDIPPWSDEIQHAIPPLDWQRLKEKPTVEKRASYIEATDLHQRFPDMTAMEVAKEITRRLALLEDTNDDTIRPDEYRAFLTPPPEGTDREFKVVAQDVPPELKSYFGSIRAVTRLREVRALKAFTRVVPPADWRDRGESGRFAPISREKLDWLPATEIKGEGIFLDFNRETLSRWEAASGSESAPADRAAELDRNFKREWKSRYPGEEVPKVITPRLLLIHSFAHALMRQLAIESGYSESSLRERLYVARDESSDMAGLLVYTATPDADGTLGGLSRQSTPDRILPIIVGAIRSMEWCSSDPLCIDGAMAFSESQSKAACHSCMLGSETSCEEFNRLLDRASLVGTPRDRAAGYFSGLLVG
jgi:hypothetical protein